MLHGCGDGGRLTVREVEHRIESVILERDQAKFPAGNDLTADKVAVTCDKETPGDAIFLGDEDKVFAALRCDAGYEGTRES